MLGVHRTGSFPHLVAKMGFGDVAVVEGRAIAANFSFFVVYAKTLVSVDVSTSHGMSVLEEVHAAQREFVSIS